MESRSPVPGIPGGGQSATSDPRAQSPPGRLCGLGSWLNPPKLSVHPGGSRAPSKRPSFWGGQGPGLACHARTRAGVWSQVAAGQGFPGYGELSRSVGPSSGKLPALSAHQGGQRGSGHRVSTAWERMEGPEGLRICGRGIRCGGGVGWEGNPKWGAGALGAAAWKPCDLCAQMQSPVASPPGPAR